MIMQTIISFDDFLKVDLPIGTITKVETFEKAKNPSYKLWVELGIKKSSAQITRLYSKEELLNRQVLCVCNFAPRQIADFMSEILVTGFILGNDKAVVLASAERDVPNGTKLA
jgi:tRNA-binding protein